MKAQILALAAVGAALSSGCTSHGLKFETLDAYPGPADKMPCAGDMPAATADACRNDWVRIDRLRHRHSGGSGFGHDELFADVSNTGTETIFVTISAEVDGPQHNWWTQAGGAYVPPGMQKRVSTCDETSSEHYFTGVARFHARAGKAECGEWRYVEVMD